LDKVNSDNEKLYIEDTLKYYNGMDKYDKLIIDLLLTPGDKSVHVGRYF